MLKVKTVKVPKFVRAMNLDLSRELNMAAEVVKKSIRDGMESNLDVENKPLIALSDKTVEQKSKSKNKTVRKNANNPMRATGNLQKNQVVTKATKAQQRVLIDIGPTRNEIYGYHHDGEGRLPVRRTFGIRPDVPEKIDQLIIARIDRILSTL